MSNDYRRKTGIEYRGHCGGKRGQFRRSGVEPAEMEMIAKRRSRRAGYAQVRCSRRPHPARTPRLHPGVGCAEGSAGRRRGGDRSRKWGAGGENSKAPERGGHSLGASMAASGLAAPPLPCGRPRAGHNPLEPPEALASPLRALSDTPGRHALHGCPAGHREWRP